MIFDLRDPLSLEAMELVLAKKRAEGLTIGLTSGTYDVVHPQHWWYFVRCRRQCDILIVGVDSDEHVRERKGPGRPIINDSQRILMVNALDQVSYAFIMCGLSDLRRAAEFIKPDFIFRNDEYAGREGEVVGREHAGKVVIVYDTQTFQSTSEIVTAIAKRSVTKK